MAHGYRRCAFKIHLQYQSQSIVDDDLYDDGMDGHLYLTGIDTKVFPAVLLINLSWRHTLYDRNLFLRTSTKKVQSLRMAHFYHSGIYLPLNCDSLFYDLGT